MNKILLAALAVCTIAAGRSSAAPVTDENAFQVGQILLGARIGAVQTASVAGAPAAGTSAREYCARRRPSWGRGENYIPAGTYAEQHCYSASIPRNPTRACLASGRPYLECANEATRTAYGQCITQQTAYCEQHIAPRAN